jgi:hypothetical protein
MGTCDKDYAVFLHLKVKEGRGANTSTQTLQKPNMKKGLASHDFTLP